MNFREYRIISLSDRPSTEKLLKTLKFLNAAIENPKLYLRTDKLNQYTETKISFKSKHLRKMLKKCIVKHRFIDAAKVLECLSCETDSNKIIYKAGFQVLENHPSASRETVPQFARHLMYLKCVQKNEVVLENAIYLMKHKRFQEAQQNLQEYATHKAKHALRTDPFIEGILSGYNGLLQYVEWAQQKENIEQIDDTVDMFRCEQMLKVAERAIDIFQGLLQSPGQWDIFILKLMKILEHYQKLDELQEALTLYSQTNPDHLNAHIYLFEFSKKHSFHQEKEEEYLQKIKDLSPSDKRILKYVPLIEAKDTQNSVSILFDYLNYATNKDDLEAWTMLAGILKKSMKHGTINIEEIWSEYDSFWPAYQFSTSQLNVRDEHSVNLAIQKALVLCMLNNNTSDHPYLDAVYAKLTDSTYQNLLSELKKNIKKVRKLRKS